MAGKVIQGFYAGVRPRPFAPVVPQPVRPHSGVAQASGTSESFPVDPGRLGLASGGGHPLPDAVRAHMEAAFNTDFSGVRVHVGAQAERIGALAFTIGSDIYFAPGRFQPNTTQGREILGHELAHVVQQRAGRVRNPFGSGVAVVQDRALEAEADRLGRRASVMRPAAQIQPATARPGAAATAPGSAQMLQRLPNNAPGRGLVAQRDVLPGQTDPLTNLSDPNARGLLYGISKPRSRTTIRLNAQDQHLNLNVRRTIDEYNRDIGLNDVMDAQNGTDPTAIFRVRAALLENDVVGNWRRHFPNAQAGMENDADLSAWLLFLEANTFRVGLFDLGAPHQVRADYAEAAKRRRKKLESKHRFSKNFKNKQQYKATSITAVPDKHNTTTSLFNWLAADHTLAQARNDVQHLADDEKEDLAKWIRTAFWRRTSKLGIDFTTSRGFTIHFNTAGDRKWDPSKATKLPTWRAGDLKKIKNDYGRMITSSEYKHAKKMVKRGVIPAARINFYDEF